MDGRKILTPTEIRSPDRPQGHICYPFILRKICATKSLCNKGLQCPWIWLLWVGLCRVTPYSLIIWPKSLHETYLRKASTSLLLTFLLLSRRCLVRKLSLLQGEKACCSWGLLLPPHSGRLPSGQTLRLCSLVQPKSWTLEANSSVQQYVQNSGYAVWLNTEVWWYVPASPSYCGFTIHIQCSVVQYISRLSDKILRGCRVLGINL